MFGEDPRHAHEPFIGKRADAAQQAGQGRVYGPQVTGLHSRSAALVESDETIHTETQLFTTGADYIFEVIVAAESGERINATIEQALYRNGSGDLADLIPGGASVNETDWQLIGPYRSLMKKSGVAVAMNEVCFHTFLRNISAGVAVPVSYTYRVRYMANRGDAIT